MTQDEIRAIALEVAKEMGFRCVEDYILFATRFLAAINAKAEPVAEVHGDSFSLRSISEMTSKLTALIEAAKASIEAEGAHPKWLAEVEYKKLANPATILELCALLEKAEKALKAQVEDKRDGPFFHEDEHPKGSCLRNSEEALAAIKQWKEQT